MVYHTTCLLDLWKVENYPGLRTNIKIKNISQKQWPLFLIELNLMAKTWRRFGPIVDIKAKNFDKIIKWGRKKHGDTKED